LAEFGQEILIAEPVKQQLEERLRDVAFEEIESAG
jgi:hypothetical protein